MAWLVSDREASDLCSELLCLISLQHCSVRVLLAQRLFGVTNRGPTGTTFQQAERIISSWTNLTSVRMQRKSQLDMWGLSRMDQVSLIQYVIAISNSCSRVRREIPYQCWLLSYHGLRLPLPASGLLPGMLLVRMSMFSPLINVLLIS